MRLIQSVFAPALALVIALASAPAMAEPLPKPTGPVLLTISGDIEITNTDEGTAAFDLAMLREIGQSEIETTTIWTEGRHRFTGVSLKALLERVGAKGKMLKATAINDYSVEIPTSDAVRNGPIVAYEMDGQTMSRREKGPLWVIYPYSSSSDYRSEVIYSRSIWQLDRISLE
ncbi:oxidoreductase [Thioclava dalianensis]|uniref:Oxidoreductase n=1 Tax=Thioclava dalianensis TaxID=1185766 RepID=A0A074U927_9RHOB|nr:molybdopterin-dependent oxidoreductase [Thioclava dalianensis]KEP71182.1 oxidoreductase [Thioclava dalianensis]SFN23214.1 hypothetical protein SAMN05216224_10376 [Thioclava dalianensis]